MKISKNKTKKHDKITYNYLETKITSNSGVIFVTKKTNSKIKIIRQKLCDKYDEERHSKEPTKIFKYMPIVYIDDSIYCYFVDGVPNKLIYGGEDLGEFNLEQKEGQTEIPMYFSGAYIIPEYEKFKEILERVVPMHYQKPINIIDVDIIFKHTVMISSTDMKVDMKFLPSEQNNYNKDKLYNYQETIVGQMSKNINRGLWY